MIRRVDVKVYGYTFWEVTQPLSYLLPSLRGFSLKGKNLLLLEQILSFRLVGWLVVLGLTAL